MIKNKYKNIVYGASIKGIVKSIELMQESNSVLLLNKFGFTGGSITEALRLLIAKNLFELNNETIESKIYQRILNEKYSILGSTENEFVVNPEVVKIVLLQFIDEYKVDHLFHVVPSSIKNNNIELVAKEGLINLEFDNFYDSSDEKALEFLVDKKNRSLKRFYNIILTKPDNLKFTHYERIIKNVILKDGRFFTSLELLAKDEIDANHKAQFIADDLNEYLQKSGNRIQLLPTRIDEVPVY